MESYFKNKNLLDLLAKWKKQLLIVAIASIILGTVIAFIIPPLYRSSTILYPVNLPTMSVESKSEQMLQILQSIDIKKKIFDSFDLGAHYKLDKTNQYFFSNLLEEFDSKVFYKKTDFEGISISVFDENPQIACNLVDSLVKFYNQKVESLHKQKNYEMVEIKGREMVKKKRELDSLEKLQKDFRLKYGIFDVGAQGKELTRGMISGKDGNTQKRIDTLIRNINERAGEFAELSNNVWFASQQLNSIKDEYEKHLSEVNKNITYCVVVEHPFPSDKKVYPVRALVILFTFLTFMAFAVIAIIFIESRRVVAK